MRNSVSENFEWRKLNGKKKPLHAFEGISWADDSRNFRKLVIDSRYVFNFQESYYKIEIAKGIGKILYVKINFENEKDIFL